MHPLYWQHLLINMLNIEHHISTFGLRIVKDVTTYDKKKIVLT